MQLASEWREDGKACYLDMPGLIHKRVQQACELRKKLGLPGSGTDVYRCVVKQLNNTSLCFLMTLMSICERVMRSGLTAFLTVSRITFKPFT